MAVEVEAGGAVIDFTYSSHTFMVVQRNQAYSEYRKQKANGAGATNTHAALTQEPIMEALMSNSTVSQTAQNTTTAFSATFTNRDGNLTIEAKLSSAQINQINAFGSISVCGDLFHMTDAPVDQIDGVTIFLIDSQFMPVGRIVAALTPVQERELRGKGQIVLAGQVYKITF